MNRVLVLRASAKDEERRPGDDRVDLLVTHEIVARPEGIAEALAFPPEGAVLAVTSKTTVGVLSAGDGGRLLAAPFALLLAAGEETARAMREAGARDVTVPDLPGAAGVISVLLGRAHSPRLLWPHGSDADTAPFRALAKAGATLSTPVVYEKRPLADPDPALVVAFSSGAYAAVAVASLAALDVLLASLAARGLPLPPVRWGVLGPATARAFTERGLPPPVVPPHARLAELIDILMET